MQVHQILRWKDKNGVITVAPSASLQEVAEMLSVRRIGAVVVSPDGANVMGILSERDIVRELGKCGPSCLSETVETIMTKKIVTCSKEEAAEDILRRMTEGRFRHMPVVENEKMIGIISIGDVVSARLSELSMEKEALEGMIKGF